MGQTNERDFFMGEQEFLISRWKKPGYAEQLYRALLVGKLKLPMTKFDKFNAPVFTGHRWSFIQPNEEAKALELALNNRTTSVSFEIEKQGGDPDAVFASIAKDEAKWKELGFERITGVPKPAQETEEQAGNDSETPKKADAKTKAN
jgi:capsid protein